MVVWPCGYVRQIRRHFKKKSKKKYVLFDVDTRYPQVRQAQKIDPTKKSFFYFCSPTISQQAVLFRKAIRPLPASLSSREKSFRSVILTGFFDCRHSLFWGGYQIYQSGDLKKSIKKKIFFFSFFLKVTLEWGLECQWSIIIMLFSECNLMLYKNKSKLLFDNLIINSITVVWNKHQKWIFRHCGFNFMLLGNN